jgi:4-amino-4-deoxy-L-arabinose transferase-like glycosyltransferase
VGNHQMMMNRINRCILKYALLGLLLLIGTFTVISLRQPWGKLPENSWLWFLLIIVGVGSGYLVAQIVTWIPDLQPEVRQAQNKRQSRIVLYCILGSLMLCVWIVLRLWPDFSQWDGTFLPWISSIGLMIFAGWLIGSIDTEPSQESNPADASSAKSKLSSLQWAEVCGFILILFLALFLRVYQIDRIPSGIFVDETNASLDALHILEGNHASPFATGWYETPNLYFYYMAVIIKILGANFVSLKIISLLPAILSVIAVFFLGRLLFGPTAGLSTMLFMAVSRWHLTLSRWGWNELMPPLFLILALYFLIRGLKGRRAIEFILGGILCGLMVYTYVASRMAVAIILLYCVYWLFANPGGIKKNLLANWKGLALFWLTAVIVVSPLMVTYFKDPFVFFNRIQEVSIFNDVKQQNSYQPLVDNLIGHLKFFYQAGDNNGRHNLPGEPELDPIAGLLFVIGIGYSIFRFRDTRSGLLWIWLILGLAGGILSSQSESPQSFRTIIAIPAIVLFCASVLDPLIRGMYTLLCKIKLFSQKLLNNGPQISKAAVVSGAILLLTWGGTTVWESQVYFGPQANSDAVQYAFNLTENQLAREVVKKLENGDRVYLSGHFYYFSVLSYLAAGLMEKTTGSYQLDNRPYQLIRPEVDIPIPDNGKSATFFIDVYNQSLIDYFKIFYPAATTQIINGPGNNPLYIQIDIPQTAVQAIQGLRTKYTHADGKIENGIAPNIDDVWEQNDIITAEWAGGIRLEKSGFYEFENEGDLTINVDGRPLNGRHFFCNGLHDIAVYQKNSRQQKLAHLLWVLPDGQEEIVPPQSFFQTQVPQLGLLGQYYNNATWQGDPICTKLTPFFLLSWADGEPVPAPFSARYTGYLKIAQSGNYHFTINADDGVRLTLDNQVVGEGLIPNQPNNLELDLKLEDGYHPIQIDYFQSGGGNTLEFYWRPPNSDQVPVPPWALSPTKP